MRDPEVNTEIRAKLYRDSGLIHIVEPGDRHHSLLQKFNAKAILLPSNMYAMEAGTVKDDFALVDAIMHAKDLRNKPLIAKGDKIRPSDDEVVPFGIGAMHKDQPFDTEDNSDPAKTKTPPAGIRKVRYFVGAKIVAGRRKGGRKVLEFGIMSPYLGECDEYPDAIIEVSQLAANGALNLEGHHIWPPRKGLRNAKNITVVKEKGEFIRAYNRKRKLIYKEPDETDRNAVYVDAVIKNGRRKGGRFIGAYPNGLGKNRIKHRNFIVCNVELGGNGELTLLSEHQWVSLAGYKNAKGVTVVVKKKNKIAQAYDKEGRMIYPKRQVGAEADFGVSFSRVLRYMRKFDEKGENAVYVKARIKKGKRWGGVFIGNWRSGIRDEVLEKFPDCVVVNAHAKHDGTISLAGGKCRAGLGAKYSYEKGLTIVIKGKIIQQVYNKRGKCIYDISEGPEWPVRLYASARVVKGKRIGGRLMGEYNIGIPEDIYEQYPDAVIEIDRLTSTGQLKIGGELIWGVRKELSYATNITAVKQGGEIITVYDKDGREIYVKPDETAVSAVFIKARIKDGKRIGGKFTGSFPGTGFYGITKKFLKQHPDFILCNVTLNFQGGFGMAGKPEWQKLKGHESEAGVTIVIENKKAKTAYDKEGNRIFGQNAIYINTTVKDGKLVKGDFVKAWPYQILKSVLSKYPDCVIVDTSLADGSTTLSMGGSNTYLSKEYAGSKGMTAVRENGKITKVFDSSGIQIYPYTEKDERAVFINAKIKTGRRVGGKFIGAYPSGIAVVLIKEYPNCIITNVNIPKDGFCSIGGLKQRLPANYRGIKGTTVVVKNRRIAAIFDGEGMLLYEWEGGQTTEKVSELISSGDIERLLVNFGLEGTYRMLLRVHEFTPFTLRELLSGYVDRKAEAISRVLEPPAKRKFSFKRARALDTEGLIPTSKIDVLADEITRSVYWNIAEDFRFLDELLKESKNSKNSNVLREAYKRTYSYYNEIAKFKIRWVNEGAISLKFFQKMGIKFLIEKEKAILADEPGLGKTIQAIAAALNLNNGKGARKVLIVCPKSAKRIWQYEIETKTTGGQTVALVSGVKDLLSRRKKRHIRDARFVIVNYGAIRGIVNLLRPWLKQLGFDCVIVDEAHRIRSKSLQTKAIQEFDVEYKFLVTGTPLVGRKVSKIFNLLNWIAPEVFTNKRVFANKYGRKVLYIKQFNEDVREYLIRRIKREVLDMPPVNYFSIPVTLDKTQRKIYDDIANVFKRWVSRHDKKDKGFLAEASSKFFKMKQAAISTGLVENQIIFRWRNEEVSIPYTQDEVTLNGATYAIIRDEKKEGDIYLLDKRGKRLEILEEAGQRSVRVGRRKYKVRAPLREEFSAKYEQMDKLLADINKRGEKTLIFTTYRKPVFDLKERYRSYGVNYILGGMSEASVEREIERFQNDADSKVFIATIAAGGEAISLTSANNIIFVDMPWTPQERDQAIDRIDRLGQKRPVNVYNLVARDTIDEYVEELLRKGDVIFKLALEGDPSLGRLDEQMLEIVLRKFRYSDRIKEKMMVSLRHKMEKESLRKKKTEATVVIDKAAGMKVRFDGDKFYAQLGTGAKGLVECRSLQELVEVSPKLSQKSKLLLKDFFQKRSSWEVARNIPVKKSILWHLLTVVQPRMADIDYHGDIEMKIEIGRYILCLLAANEDITVEDLSAHIEDRGLLIKSLYFMDKNNIFKALSLLGILNKQFYYKGLLLSYDPPLNIYPAAGQIKYVDEVIAERIAPCRFNPRVKILPDEPFESECRRYRKLGRDEEIRLAREAKKGNVVAQEALINANKRMVIPLARKIFSNVKSRVGDNALLGLEREELYAAGVQEMIERLPGYYYEFVHMTFADYIRRFLSKPISTYTYRYARNRIKERHDVVREDLAHPVPLSDLVLAKRSKPEVRVVKIAEKGLVQEAIVILTDSGLTEEDIDIFFDSADGLSPGEISKKHTRSVDYVKDTIARAQQILKASEFFTKLQANSSSQQGGVPQQNQVGKTSSNPHYKATSKPASSSAEGETQRSYASEDKLGEVKQAFRKLDKEAWNSGLRAPLSALSGIRQRMKGISKLRLCVPVEVFKNSADITLTINRLGKLREGISFELIVTGVTKKDTDVINGLNRKDIKQTLNLPENLTVTMIQEEEIKKLADKYGYEVSNPRDRARIIKDMYLGGLAKGEYMAIVTDAVPDEDKDSLIKELRGEVDRNISIRVLVKPEENESMFSLSAIINDWLKNIHEGNKSTIDFILPAMISPAEMIEKLDEAIRSAWEVLTKA